MAPHLHAVHSVDLDLTDESSLLTEDFVNYHPDGVRNLLAALNLREPGSERPESVVIDMAVYRATGNAHLATLFSAAS